MIADRTRENLGASDLGIAMMRKRLFEELDAMARGAEPKGIVRSSNVAKCIELPNITKKTSTEGITLAEYPQLSAAQRPPERLPPLLRPAAGGAQGLRRGDGHCAVAVN